MDFGGIDLRQLLGRGTPSVQSYNTPTIKANQEPLQNSWNADGTFQLGYPRGSEPRPVGPPPVGFTPPPPPPPQNPGAGATPVTPTPVAPPSGGNTQNPPAGGGAPMPSTWQQVLNDRPDVRRYYEQNPAAWNGVGRDWDRAAQTWYERHGQFEGYQLPTGNMPAPASTPTPPAGFTPPTVNVGGGAAMPTSPDPRTMIQPAQPAPQPVQFPPQTSGRSIRGDFNPFEAPSRQRFNTIRGGF